MSMNYKIRKIFASLVIFLTIITAVQAQEEPSPDLAKQVLVSLNKDIYSVGEPIAVTIQNNSAQSLFSHAASVTPGMAVNFIEQKSINGEWIRHQVRCGYPECYLDIDFPGEILPQKSITFSWMPTIHYAGKNPDLSAPEGTYRIVVDYQIRKGEDSKQWKSFAITSGEFVIK